MDASPSSSGHKPMDIKGLDEDTEEEKYLVLKSGQEKEFKVEKKVARQSNLIRTMVEGGPRHFFRIHDFLNQIIWNLD